METCKNEVKWLVCGKDDSIYVCEKHLIAAIDKYRSSAKVNRVIGWSNCDWPDESPNITNSVVQNVDTIEEGASLIGMKITL